MENVLPHASMEDVLPHASMENVLPQDTREDVLPQDTREDVLPQDIRQVCGPRIRRAARYWRRLIKRGEQGKRYGSSFWSHIARREQGQKNYGSSWSRIAKKGEEHKNNVNSWSRIAKKRKDGQGSGGSWNRRAKKSKEGSWNRIAKRMSQTDDNEDDLPTVGHRISKKPIQTFDWMGQGWTGTEKSKKSIMMPWNRWRRGEEKIPRMEYSTQGRNDNHWLRDEEHEKPEEWTGLTPWNIVRLQKKSILPLGNVVGEREGGVLTSGGRVGKRDGGRVTSGSWSPTGGRGKRYNTQDQIQDQD